MKQKLANLMTRSYKQQLKGSILRQRPASQLWPLVGSALKCDSLNELGSSSTLLATFLSVLLSLVTASAQQGALAFFYWIVLDGFVGCPLGCAFAPPPIPKFGF